MSYVGDHIRTLPNRHERNATCDVKHYKPVWTPGERYSNMINSSDLVDLTNKLTFKIGVVDSKGNLVSEDVGALSFYDEAGSAGRIAWDVSIFPALVDGIYRLVIYETAQNKILFLSNEHQVINSQNKLQQETAYFEYRHTAKIYHRGFEELSAFYIRERLHVNAINQEEVFQVEEYEEVTTGESYNPRFDVDLDIEIETENYDAEAHKAFAIMLAHNDKSINGKPYVLAPGSAYKKTRNPNAPIWNGSVVIRDQEFSTINKQ